MQNNFQVSTMYLYFDGCSYTRGGPELYDRESENFPTLVSNHFKAEFLNNAAGGSSNDLITQRSLEFLEHYTCDYAIILLTHPERLRFNKTTYPNRDRNFYEKYYNDEVGSLNFYKNRYILEQTFRKRNIPLLLLQYIDIPGDNVYKRMCNGSLQSVVGHVFFKRQKSILGKRRNEEYYYSERQGEILSHFNKKGHRKVADYIIKELSSAHGFLTI